MFSHSIPPYEDIINFGCLLDILSELPVKKASEGLKEKSDKFTARAHYDAALEDAETLHDITEILYEMLDTGLYPVANFLKMLIAKLFRLKQYAYVIRLFDLIQAAGISDIELTNKALQSCRQESACENAYRLFEAARLAFKINSNTYCIMLSILAIDRSRKVKPVLAMLKQAQDLHFDSESVYAAALCALQHKTKRVNIGLEVFAEAKAAGYVNAVIVNRMLKILSRSHDDCLNSAEKIYTEACSEGYDNDETAELYQEICAQYQPGRQTYFSHAQISSPDKNTEAANQADQSAKSLQKQSRICSYGLFAAAAKVATISAAIAVTGWVITKSGF